MEFVVLLKQVPDLAEELEIDASGTDLARDWLSYVTSEWDEYALEEALQLRDLVGGTVTCLALDTGSVDELLATCLARGADRVDQGRLVRALARHARERERRSPRRSARSATTSSSSASRRSTTSTASSARSSRPSSGCRTSASSPTSPSAPTGRP